MKRYTFLSYFFIFLISLISVFDLFITSGRSATFDGPTHMTDIAGYSLALKDGNFPVFWLDGFGNYGMPVGLYSHQLLLTIAGFINIFVHNPVFIFCLFFFLAVFLTNITFYLFLRLYFSPPASLAGITLLTFSAYRLLNIYIRGDLPETFSGIFLGTMLLGIYYFIAKKKAWGFFLIAFSYFCLSLTHPLMLITYSFFIFPYLIFLLWQQKDTIALRITYFVSFLLAMLLGIAMAAYFLMPLVLETKYLYFGQEKNHLSPQFLGIQNFLGESWYYYFKTDIFVRGQFVQTGLLETLTIICGLLYFIYVLLKKGLKKSVDLLPLTLLCAFAVIFMTTAFALPIYLHVPEMSSLQFPWRILSLFIFLCPILLAFLLDKLQMKIFIIVAIVIIFVVRFPQLYGKNYTVYPVVSYYFTPYNLFPIDYNPIWTGRSQDYPIEKNKIAVISGSAKIISEKVSNAERLYVVNDTTAARFVDYTFYFPGWIVYVDGQPVQLQFQDPAYRGVITYDVPAGQHTIRVVLQDTTIRKFAKILSLIFIGIFLILFFLRNKLLSIFFDKKK